MKIEKEKLLIENGKLHQKLVSAGIALKIGSNPDDFVGMSEGKARKLLQTYQELLFQCDPVELRRLVGPFVSPATWKQQNFIASIHERCLEFAEYNIDVGYDFEGISKYEAQVYIKIWKKLLDATKSELDEAVSLANLYGDDIPVDTNGRYTKRVVEDFVRRYTSNVDSTLTDITYDSELEEEIL